MPPAPRTGILKKMPSRCSVTPAIASVTVWSPSPSGACACSKRWPTPGWPVSGKPARGNGLDGGPHCCPRAVTWRRTRAPRVTRHASRVTLHASRVTRHASGRHASPFVPTRSPATWPSRLFYGDGNGQVGAPRPGDGGPGWGTKEMVGNRKWMTRVEMHEMAAHPTHCRLKFTVEAHLRSCRYSPTSGEVRLTRSVLGPDALPPLPRPNLPEPDPP